MASQPEKLTMAIHILPNISRSKVKSDSKSGKLIEKKIFVEKSYTKCGGETISSLKFCTLCFYCMSLSRTIEIY